MNDYLVAVELCTSKVAIAVAERASYGIRVLYHHAVPVIKGMNRGDVINNKIITDALDRCKREIEIESGLNIKDVILCVTSSSIKTKDWKKSVIRQNSGAPISYEEISYLTSEATRSEAGNEVVFEAIPQSFNVDDAINVSPDEVEGMTGKVIEAKYKLIIGKNSSLKNKHDVVESCGMRVIGTIMSPVASSYAALNEDEIENGVALIDIGAGTTDVVIVKDRIVREVAVIPFGGNTITADIRNETTITTDNAEIIKIKYGCCMDEGSTENKKLVIQGTGGSENRDVPLDLLEQVIEARVSEIMEAAYYVIEQAGYISKIPAGLVITGGTAYLERIRDLAKAITGFRVRLANAQGNIADTSVDGSFDTYACSIVGALIDGFNHEEDLRKKAGSLDRGEIVAPPKQTEIDFGGEPIEKLTWREKIRRDREAKNALKREEAERKEAAKEAARKAKQEAELKAQLEAEEEERREAEEEARRQAEKAAAEAQPKKPGKIEKYMKDLFTTDEE